MTNEIKDFNKKKSVLESKQDSKAENISEISEIKMNGAENISEIKIENKKIYSLSLNKNCLASRTAPKSRNSKLKFSASNKTEIQIEKNFQTLTKENNVIEWKSDQPMEIRIC